MISGHGNEDDSGFEGAITAQAHGTYLHGPVLPKNPALADHLLRIALARHGRELTPLDDRLEIAAADRAADLQP